MKVTLEKAKHQFDTWRQSKKCPKERIPKELWSIAVELTKTHTQSEVAKTLGLNCSCLSKHRRKPLKPKPKAYQKNSSPTFLELAIEPLSTIGQCTRIELERADGHRMKMVSDNEHPFDIKEMIHLFLD